MSASGSVRMTTSQLIAFLNALSLGDVDSLRAKLAEAAAACRDLDRAELAALLEEAQGALAEGDVKGFRKRVETAVSRLGHLR